MAPYSDTFVPTESPLDSTRMAWSKHKRQWVTMTFVEFQAWLARPDLDPAEFSSGEMP